MTGSTLQTGKQIKSAFGGLEPREKTILLERLQGKPLSKISKQVKLSAPRVFQIEKGAWDKLVQSPVPESKKAVKKAVKKVSKKTTKRAKKAKKLSS